MAVVLISFALHPSGHYLYLILLTGSWGAGTSSECVMQKGGTKDENDGKRLTGLASVCSTNTSHFSLSFDLRTRIHFTFKFIFFLRKKKIIIAFCIEPHYKQLLEIIYCNTLRTLLGHGKSVWICWTPMGWLWRLLPSVSNWMWF